MIVHGLKKIGYALSIILGVAIVVFFLFHLSSSDPVRNILGENVSAEIIENTRHKWHLDESLSTQFFVFLNQLSPISYHPTDVNSAWYLSPTEVSGWSWPLSDGLLYFKFPYLSRSYISGESVNGMLAGTVPATFLLAVISTLLAAILGIALGVYSAIKVHTFQDKLILTLSSLGMSAPSFFVAVFLAWLLAVEWRNVIYFPVIPFALSILVYWIVGKIQEKKISVESVWKKSIWQWGLAIFVFMLTPRGWVLALPGTHLPLTGSLYELDPWEGKRWSLENMILPVLTLMIRPLGVVVQLTRSSILDVMGQDFIRTAYAKGLSKSRVMWKHALPNALNPVLTSISGWFASLLAGAVFVEFVFGWKGLGQLMFTAIERQDLPVISGGVMVISTSFVVIGFLMDGVYRWLDPRVRK